MNIKSEKMKKLSEKIRADKKAVLVFIIGIAGVILLVLSETVPDSSAADKGKKEEFEKSDYNIENHYEYAEMLENKLADLISSISGAGKTKVMITFETSSEAVYAQNDKNAEENGEREKITRENDYVLIKTDSSKEEALLIKIIQPKIKGVAVVCEGGDSVYVKQEIIETVTAVFDISSSKIQVTKLSKDKQGE